MGHTNICFITHIIKKNNTQPAGERTQMVTALGTKSIMKGRLVFQSSPDQSERKTA